MILGNPVRGVIHGSGWKRPAGNHDPRLVRGFAGQEPLHDGIDISFGRVGDPILAAASGRVVFAQQPAGDSLYVVIDHGGTRTLYGHLNDKTVSVGEDVKAGDVIGHCGHTGTTIPSGPPGAHLHFEVFSETTNRRSDPWPQLAQNVRVRPDGAGINIRSKPTLNGSRYAITRAKGYIERLSDGQDLGSAAQWRAWDGTVTGATYIVDGKQGNRWERIYLAGAYRYVASALATRSAS